MRYILITKKSCLNVMANQMFDSVYVAVRQSLQLFMEKLLGGKTSNVINTKLN